MLGIRLDAQTEAGLARVAKLSGRTRSDIAREAICNYLRVAEQDDALDQELKAIGKATREADLAMLDTLNDELCQIIEQDERKYAQDRAG